MSKKHAICSASGASRWLACPGSVWASIEAQKQGLVEIKPSIYAEDGTKCHAIAESMLRKYVLGADEVINLDNPPEMIEAADFYLLRVMEQIESFDSKPDVKIEISLVFDKSLDMFGTADCAMTGFIAGVPTGVIMDLKYGKTKVVAENNSQLAFYACALKKASSKKLETIKVVIVQPRLKKPITEVEYNLEELNTWEEKLRSGAEKALNQLLKPTEREFNIGPHCKFCDGLLLCPAKNKPPDEGEGLEFEQVDEQIEQ